MANAVIVTTQLPPAEAEALLAALREQYRLASTSIGTPTSFALLQTASATAQFSPTSR